MNALFRTLFILFAASSSYFFEIPRIFFAMWLISCIVPGLFVRYILLGGRETEKDKIIYMRFLFPLKAFLYLWNLFRKKSPQVQAHNS